MFSKYKLLIEKIEGEESIEPYTSSNMETYYNYLFQTSIKIFEEHNLNIPDEEDELINDIKNELKKAFKRSKELSAELARASIYILASKGILSNKYQNYILLKDKNIPDLLFLNIYKNTDFYYNNYGYLTLKLLGIDSNLNRNLDEKTGNILFEHSDSNNYSIDNLTDDDNSYDPDTAWFMINIILLNLGNLKTFDLNIMKNYENYKKLYLEAIKNIFISQVQVQLPNPKPNPKSNLNSNPGLMKALMQGAIQHQAKAKHGGSKKKIQKKSQQSPQQQLKKSTQQSLIILHKFKLIKKYFLNKIDIDNIIINTDGNSKITKIAVKLKDTKEEKTLNIPIILNYYSEKYKKIIPGKKDDMLNSIKNEIKSKLKEYPFIMMDNLSGEYYNILQKRFYKKYTLFCNNTTKAIEYTFDNKGFILDNENNENNNNNYNNDNYNNNNNDNNNNNSNKLNINDVHKKSLPPNLKSIHEKLIKFKQLYDTLDYSSQQKLEPQIKKIIEFLKKSQIKNKKNKSKSKSKSKPMLNEEMPNQISHKKRNMEQNIQNEYYDEQLEED